MYLLSFPNLDLFSAGIHALNGVQVARKPFHDRGYTLHGLVIMVLFGGIGRVSIAALAGGVYSGIALLMKESSGFFPVTLIAVLASFLFRVWAVRDHRPQSVPGGATGEQTKPTIIRGPQAVRPGSKAAGTDSEKDGSVGKDSVGGARS